MLRSVDDWEGEHFSFGAASAAATAAPTVGPTRIAIDNGSDGPSATIPDSHLLFTAQFSRAGADLVLTGEDGKAFAVHDYFATDARAKLLSAEGAALSPDVVAALAGPLAPGQYAQAGTAQPSVKAVGRVVQADGDATIVRNGVAMAAHAGDAILKGDVLQTVTGTFGVTFNDGSTLNLTANSRLVVNEFVYDPKGSANSQLLDLVQGSLTFISGEVAHNGDMKIGTPVATMAIRGTVGGVTTANDGTVNFYVSQSATGAVILDSRGTVIANVVQDGPLIIVRPVGPLQVLAEEVQKSPAQLATELAALQQIVSIQSVGQQIIQQFFQQDPNANPNPQSTDKPHTQFQIDLHTNNPTGPNGTPGPIDGNPAPPPSATVTQTTTDGDGNKTTTVEEVKIPANLAPLTFGPLQQAVNEDTALVFSSAHQNAISVFDADTASLTVTVAAAHGVLSLSGVAGLTFTSGDGIGDATMTFSGTQDAINAALEGMSFTPAAEYSGPASVSVTTTDGHSTSATDTIAITVAAVNDAPVIAQPNSPTMAYTENQAATAIDAVLTLSDVDSATLSGATVTVSCNFHTGEDVLGFTNQNGITGSYSNGVLTLTGAASVADYQTALRAVTYFNSSDNPSSDTRTISYQVDDGAGTNHASNIATASVTVTPVNDAPVIAQASSPTLAYTENQTATAIDAVLALSDADNANLTGATVSIGTGFHTGEDVLGFINQNGITSSYVAATGILTLSGSSSVANYEAALHAVTYFNSSDNPSAATRTISYQLDDGQGANHASNIATATVSVTPVNDAPTGDVAVSGRAQQGQVLTADVSTLANAEGLGALHYQWQHYTGGAFANIIGATGATYTATANDVGEAVRVVVGYTDGGGTHESVTSAATANIQPTTNYSFETGDYTGWSTLGPTSVVASGSGQNPTDGSHLAFLSAGGSSSASSIESFLGVQSNALPQFADATDGSAIKISLSVVAGTVVTADWNFIGVDYLPYNDFAFVTTNGSATLLSSISSFANGASSGWRTFTFTAATTGTLNLGFGIINGHDNVFNSELLIDNLHVTYGAGDPIVVDLGAPGISLSSAANNPVAFDLNADGIKEQIGWTSGEDGILVVDLDHSGAIENGHEVFSPAFGKGGFADALDALRSYDSNGDGVLDARDAAFNDILVWQDANHDGISQPGELASLKDHGIASLDLNANPASEQVNGQQVIAEGQLMLDTGATGQYVAVALQGASPNPTVTDSAAAAVAASDTFHFAPGEGANTIANFNVGSDVIELDGFNLATVDQLLAALGTTGADARHGDAIIDLGHGDSVTVAGVTQDYLQQHLNLVHLGALA